LSGEGRDVEKRAAARAAVAEVRDGMIVGLGTGSTVAFAIDALAGRCRSGLQVEAVATSLRTEALAARAGIRMLDFATLATIDLGIDGVDEVDPSFRAIKGAGGAMLREKVVAEAAVRMIAIADRSKAVDRLGGAPVPVEVLPFAVELVASRIERFGARPAVRLMPSGEAYRTDQDNAVLDCRFDGIADPQALALALSQIPGVLGHGLFVGEIDAVYIGRGDQIERRERKA
jgi:ribose 5-phosphate isomerase A